MQNIRRNIVLFIFSVLSQYLVMEIADMYYNKDEFVETASGNKVNAAETEPRRK